MLKMFPFHFDFSASFSPCLQPLHSFLPAFSVTFFSFFPPPPKKFWGPSLLSANLGDVNVAQIVLQEASVLKMALSSAVPKINATL